MEASNGCQYICVVITSKEIKWHKRDIKRNGEMIGVGSKEVLQNKMTKILTMSAHELMLLLDGMQKDSTKQKF